jgi:hypothetical protein
LKEYLRPKNNVAYKKRESHAAFVFAAKEMLNITSCQRFPVKIEKEKLSRMDASWSVAAD